jgi:LPXTG-motif cell wall-anchored protein
MNTVWIAVPAGVALALISAGLYFLKRRKER